MHIEFLNAWKRFSGFTLISFGVYRTTFSPTQRTSWGLFTICNFTIKFRF